MKGGLTGNLDITAAPKAHPRNVGPSCSWWQCGATGGLQTTPYREARISEVTICWTFWTAAVSDKHSKSASSFNSMAFLFNTVVGLTTASLNVAEAVSDDSTPVCCESWGGDEASGLLVSSVAAAATAAWFVWDAWLEGRKKECRLVCNPCGGPGLAASPRRQEFCHAQMRWHA